MEVVRKIQVENLTMKQKKYDILLVISWTDLGRKWDTHHNGRPIAVPHRNRKRC